MDRYTTLVILLAAIFSGAAIAPSSIWLNSSPSQYLSLAVLRALHLFSFATAFGTGVWVTFIAGIVLFRSLPRHQFGHVQSKLFPAFFRLQVVACSLALAAFASLSSSHLHTQPPPPAAEAAASLQLGGEASATQLLLLAVAVAGWLSNLIVFEPITTEVMRQRHKIEREVGIGGEVGLSRNREVAKQNPSLAAINRRFGMWHGLSSLANLMALCSLGAHGWYLATSM